MNDKYLSPYDPKAVEPAIYSEEEKSGLFNPDECVNQGYAESDAETFCIIMPPPNANGSLHAGHALFVTLQDIMIRYNRMQGKRTLWYPGADHAGFETWVVFEKKLQKEGRNRFDMDPKDLYNEILAFTLENKTFMEGQIKSLGASCDWSRLLFTLDDRVVSTVYDTFDSLNEKGLVYRGNRTVNWCPKHQTSLSNLEVSYEERTEPFYYFQYGPFVIGTARPETKFGDKYVVMHPEDERYTEYEHGQQFELEWINGPITATVIKDEAGDPEMGSGVMTITPWHSDVDFQIAKRHDLDYEQIIDWRGKLLPVAGEEFEGVNIKEARAKIVEKLDSKGLLVKVDEKYDHSVPVCYKCSREIEPQIRPQWFIKMQTLAEEAVQAVNDGKTDILSEQHEKTFKNWLQETPDWNVSRQILWGIPIPAKICTECNHAEIDTKDILTECSSCGGSVEADPDTFDTWFSSGQWPFATLGYPNSADFKDYYPTTVMETGADILTFWVSRMMMLGLHATGQVPFEKVYLHGMVRDKKGLKMSKSKGNVIAPAEMQEEFGTDALRMSLIAGNTMGSPMNLDQDKVRAYKKFANKLWNVARFVYSNTQQFDYENFDPATLNEDEQKLIDAWNEVKTDITSDMDNYRLYLAAEKLYHYVWHTFADEVIESTKEFTDPETRLINNDNKKYILLHIMGDFIKALHPFMPFVTSEIWKDFPTKDKRMLLVEKW